MFRIKTTYYALTLAVTKPAITAVTRGIITAAPKAAVWFVTIATTFLAAACSKSEVVTTYEQEAAKPVVQKVEQKASNADPMSTYTPSDVPITFGLYTGQDATTRAAVSSPAYLASEGFGVFAYYTGQKYFPETSPVPEGGVVADWGDDNVYPNMMYNQQVTGVVDELDPSKIIGSYNPLKYWPNNPDDMVSFFAYAPYVPVNTATGAAKNPDESVKTTGIVGFSMNYAKSDPLVHYKLGAGSEDLMWSDANLLNQKKTTGGAVNTPAFTFKHALTALTFKVGGNFDAISGGTINEDTYITIDQVDIVSTDLPYEGSLNLRTGEWTSLKTDRPGSTALTNSEIAEHVRYKELPTTTPITPDMVNPGVGRKDNGDADDPGETYDLVKDGRYLVLIPSDDLDLDIICTYYVWTFDSRNGDGISKVKNVVKDSLSDLDLDAGKAYTITIWLGMTTVKLDVNQYGKSETGGEHWPTSQDPTINVIWK